MYITFIQPDYELFSSRYALEKEKPNREAPQIEEPTGSENLVALYIL